MRTKEEIAARLKAYRAANKEEIAAQKKAYYEANKEEIAAYRAANKEEKAAYDKAYRAANKEMIAARMKAYKEANKEEIAAYRAANKERIAAQKKAHYEANKEEIAALGKAYRKTPEGKLVKSRGDHKRRDSTKITLATLTFAQWMTIIAEQNNSCAHCRKPFTLEMAATRDHIVPVSKGGGLTYENVQALCKSCNSRKGDRFECDLPYLRTRVETTTTTSVRKITDWTDKEAF
jgi:5-methylcytosine-specific restriction endonuclease McrA